MVVIDTYGESAPAPVRFKHFGFTPVNVAGTVQSVLKLGEVFIFCIYERSI